MYVGEVEDFLNLLKATAEKQRLVMIGLMGERERTVTEMAELLELTEPTISHHVSKLHSAGLLRLRMDGNQRFYQINPKRLEKFRQYLAEIDKPAKEYPTVVNDTTWVDALDWADEDKKVLRDTVVNGRLRQIPSKDKKWVVILRWLATKFEPDVRYTEKQVSDILRQIYDDYATMRRDLIGYGFMRREQGGGDYWLTPKDEVSPQNLAGRPHRDTITPQHD
ncbi:MAG: metalloregulator ArsR/SmtB family transcription factor [Chloroflexi bacterium]|nr:metalloregulator ArsR/SmtB family transcription factor [Chloroflexota bacterium]